MPRPSSYHLAPLTPVIPDPTGAALLVASTVIPVAPAVLSEVAAPRAPLPEAPGVALFLLVVALRLLPQPAVPAAITAAASRNFRRLIWLIFSQLPGGDIRESS